MCLMANRHKHVVVQMNNTPHPRLAYDIREFCDAARIGKTKTYELIKEGRLKSTKVGKRRLILPRDAEECLASLRDE
jgi:excisionase family DNA binding protein